MMARVCHVDLPTRPQAHDRFLVSPSLSSAPPFSPRPVEQRERQRERGRAEGEGEADPGGDLVGGGGQKSMTAKSSLWRSDLKVEGDSIRSSASDPVVGGGGTTDAKVWHAGDDWATLTSEVLWRPATTSPETRRSEPAPQVRHG
jgi:hypothetical protein